MTLRNAAKGIPFINLRFVQQIQPGRDRLVGTTNHILESPCHVRITLFFISNCDVVKQAHDNSILHQDRQYLGLWADMQDNAYSVIRHYQDKKNVNPLMFVSSKPAEQSLGLIQSIIQRRIR